MPKQRCTFAIISHPDAGKTTITEKLLLFSGAIQLAGTVKARKASRHATSDWMALEKERGISVTSSVMQFDYQNKIFNLLDTPGHEDFSEDTYRTLTAVDSALMVIDAVKGVESRTIKLMQICRLRKTPIISFINKLDRDSKEPIALLDEIESILKIRCAPVTWPIGSGRDFKGVYHLLEDRLYFYMPGQGHQIQQAEFIQGLDNPEFQKRVGSDLALEFRETFELVQGACYPFDEKAFLKGELTPVFFGSALNNFGVTELLNGFLAYAPPPQSRETTTRLVQANETPFSGFVFKIQANMDPKHRDRIAFLRICSGEYTKQKKIFHTRLNRKIQVAQVLTFMAGQRQSVEQAFVGDIIGLHTHGGIQIGDTFTEGESLKFIGIPYFAPELFRAVRPKDPLKMKSLQKGLIELSEEGATQVFRPLNDNRIILGAVGVLQFDVVAHRLKYEYKVECLYESVNVNLARWISCDKPEVLKAFKQKYAAQLALDGASCLTYLASSLVNLNLIQQRHEEICFHETREH